MNVATNMANRMDFGVGAAPVGTRAAAYTVPEVIEEAGVTEVRNGFLQAVDRLQENPALRFVIRKHGKPRAVLLSAEAYDALKDLVDRVVRHSDAMPAEEQLDRAFRRLEEDRALKLEAEEGPAHLGPEQAVGVRPEQARVLVNELTTKLKELDLMLQGGYGVDEANSAM